MMLVVRRPSAQLSPNSRLGPFPQKHLREKSKGGQNTYVDVLLRRLADFSMGLTQYIRNVKLKEDWEQMRWCINKKSRPNTYLPSL